MSGTSRDRLLEDKARVRGALLRAVVEIPLETRASASGAICARLEGLIGDARGVMVYAPMASEPDVMPVARSLAARGVLVAMPRVDWEALSMSAARFDPEGELEDAGRGVWQPAASAERAPPESLEVVLAPGVGFDRACRRLGRGGGFYDRWLGQLPSGVRRVGVAFGVQLVDHVPAGAHDVVMHAVVTEDEVIPRERAKEAP